MGIARQFSSSVACLRLPAEPAEAADADIGTTANIYAHLDTTDLETALRALNDR